MNFSYIIFDNKKGINFEIKENTFVTFIGESNDYIYDNIIFKNSNDYLTMGYSKINNKYITKLYNLIGVSSFEFINIFNSETVLDELAFPLESKAIKREDMKKKIEEISTKFKFNNYLEESPYSLNISKRCLLLIMISLITEPKVLIINNLLELLDSDDFELVINVLNEYKENHIVLNFTNNIEETLLGEYIIVTNNEKVVVSGKTISVLNEEKIMKRLGHNLPFIVLLNKYLKDYNLIDRYILNYNSLGEVLWK